MVECWRSVNMTTQPSSKRGNSQNAYVHPTKRSRSLLSKCPGSKSITNQVSVYSERWQIVTQQHLEQIQTGSSSRRILLKTRWEKARHSARSISTSTQGHLSTVCAEVSHNSLIWTLSTVPTSYSQFRVALPIKTLRSTLMRVYLLMSIRMHGASATIGCRKLNSWEVIKHSGSIAATRLGRRMLSCRTFWRRSSREYKNLKRSSQISTCYRMMYFKRLYLIQH